MYYDWHLRTSELFVVDSIRPDPTRPLPTDPDRRLERVFYATICFVIKVAYGKVRSGPRWERRLCKEKGAFRKGAPSISLQVFAEAGA